MDNSEVAAALGGYMGIYISKDACRYIMPVAGEILWELLLPQPPVHFTRCNIVTIYLLDLSEKYIRKTINDSNLP